LKTKADVTALAALVQESRFAILRLPAQAGSKERAVAVAPSSPPFHLKELARANLISVR
jgi:hypothetical protein